MAMPKSGMLMPDLMNFSSWNHTAMPKMCMVMPDPTHFPSGQAWACQKGTWACTFLACPCSKSAWPCLNPEFKTCICTVIFQHNMAMSNNLSNISNIITRSPNIKTTLLVPHIYIPNHHISNNPQSFHNILSFQRQWN